VASIGGASVALGPGTIMAGESGWASERLR